MRDRARRARRGSPAGSALDELREHVRGRGRGGARARLRRPEDRRGVPLRARRRATRRDGRGGGARGTPARLADKALLELLLDDALAANAATGDPLPVQVHCGFGDADLFLPRADPALLGPLVERYARHAVRAAALLPVRARGRLARARVRQRLSRRLADDPARLARGRDGARGARARAACPSSCTPRTRRGRPSCTTSRRTGLARRAWPRCWATALQPVEAEAGRAADPARERAGAVRIGLAPRTGAQRTRAATPRPPGRREARGRRAPSPEPGGAPAASGGRRAPRPARTRPRR